MPAVAVRERPILFSTPMVRAIRAGSKTQTRRVMKVDDAADVMVQSWHQDGGDNWIGWTSDQPDLADFTKRAYPNGEGVRCPYGRVGDHLWVKETFRETWDIDDRRVLEYRAGGTRLIVDGPAITHGEHRCTSVLPKWKPSIFMPRWASRITLEVTAVRVERLQDISKADVLAEGFDGLADTHAGWHEPFAELWDSLNGLSYPWESNPWVWAVSFKRIEEQA